jgi:NodT family efflux transporter outer membrane factor (OMF) lipoprotein
MRRQLVLAAMALLAGCATVGPDYRELQMAMPERYGEATATGEVELARWWRAFGDPQLSALVERALAQNLDVAAAAARIREARALERAAGAARLPQVSAEASVTRQRISENALPVPVGAGAPGGAFALPGTEFTTWRSGLDASWEIDLFGRTRRAVEAAQGRADAAVWNRRDAEVSVAGEVASAYLRLRTLQAAIATARAELSRQQQFERLVESRTRGGLVTGQDLAQQRSERAAADAAIPALEAEAKAEVHAIGTLLGAGPDVLAGELSAPLALPAVPPIPAGLPSDLLRRRPDIRGAERRLAAATAETGVAVAELYPRFSLTAAPALVSTALSHLLEWGSRSFSAGAAVDWPLFDGGRRRAMVDVRTAQQEQALLGYRKAVLAAHRDVEDALSRIDGGRRQLGQLEAAQAMAARAEEIARVRYRGGLVTNTDVLTAQARRLGLEKQVTETRGAVAQGTVALVRALGGGWSEGGQQ